MITTELRPFAPPQPKSTAWLLPGLLPRGELVLLEGHAGVGKSLLAAAFAAKISHDDACTLLTASPSSSETLATHLARQEPHYEKLHELLWYADRDGKKDYAAEEALTKLQHHLEHHKPPLLVIDSLEESLAILAGEKESKLREFWTNLISLARHHGTTILVLARPQGRRGTARVARTAAEAAKAVYSLAYHPTDATLRVLTRTRDLTAPAGAQWHITIDPEGRLDWLEAAPTDHVAPSAFTSTWKKSGSERLADLAGALRAIEDALTLAMPAAQLREHVVRQGYSPHAFRTAMTLVDAVYKKAGPDWIYTPGPELAALQAFRRQQNDTQEAARPPAPETTSPSTSAACNAVAGFPDGAVARSPDRATGLGSPPDDQPDARPPAPETISPHGSDEELLRRSDEMLLEVQAAIAAEFGALAADAFFRTRRPGPILDRYSDLFADTLARTFTAPERKRLIQLYRDQERANHSSQSPCCVRAHADSR